MGPTGPQGPQGPPGPAGPTLTFAKWSVNWKTLTGDYQWGASVGSSQFPAVFNYNWGSSAVFQGYDDFIGFDATMQVKMQRNGPVSFTISSDDASRLSLDGTVIINLWSNGGHAATSKVVYLTPGLHTLKLEWYDIGAGAYITFTCDNDITMWYP
jgi:hypothetical protein